PGSIDGKGLADYSNRGFFTARYNLNTTEYQYPTGPFEIEARAPTKWDNTPISGGAPVYIHKGTVRDTVTGSSATQEALTSSCLGDQFMKMKGAQPSYTLNRVNYDAMADLLIPRAVAYSAGLLDYFFRGKMEISLPDAGFYGVVDQSLFVPPNPGIDA